MVRRRAVFWLAPPLVALLSGAPALAQGYEGYPYSIMTPERGPGGHHRAATSERQVRPPRTHQEPATPPGPRIYARRGSSGSVLPTPLPKTPLIPPEGGGRVTTHPFPEEQGRTLLPNGSTVPNLAHGPETFQDRASRCSFQAGLYGVPSGTTPQQYMGACVQ